jgi:hypothetical protein
MVYLKYAWSYMLLALIGFAILVLADLISGMSLADALNIIRHTFSIVTPFEYFMIPIAAISPFVIMVWNGKKK